jgi:RNA polymerase sigma-70 factor, ECF subfamily
MNVVFAIPHGATMPLHAVVASFDFRAMTVPRADAAAASPGFVHLLQAVVERRDQSSFMTLFDYYAPRVKAYLKRLGTSDSVAEDLSQEVMLAVWRKAATYDPAKAGVGTWIFTIARNLRIDALRRERRPALDPDDPCLVPDPAPPADQVIAVQREQEQVRSALRHLPVDQVQVVTMAFYDGKSHGEIASELAIPLGTVKSRLRLAFRRVRTLVGDPR